MTIAKKAGALASAAALTLSIGLLGATPAQAASTSTLDRCTITANKPTWDARRQLLNWSVTVDCPFSGMYQMLAEVWEDDPVGDDYQFNSGWMGWLAYGRQTVSGNGRITNTEIGNEEIYVKVRYQVKKGSPWRTLTSPVLSVNY